MMKTSLNRQEQCFPLATNRKPSFYAYVGKDVKTVGWKKIEKAKKYMDWYYAAGYFELNAKHVRN